MSELPVQVVVALFEKEKEAAYALQSLKAAKREKLFKIKQAHIVWRDKKARIHFKDIGDLNAGQGALVGGVIGAGLALLSRQPAARVGVSGAVGAVMGGLVSSLWDRGMPNERLQELGEMLLPGTSLLITVIEHQWVKSIGATLKKAGADIVFKTLKDEFMQRWSQSSNVSYAAYKNDQPVEMNQAEGKEQTGLGNLLLTDKGVVIKAQVLTRAGLTTREIVINEKGIFTHDTLIPKQVKSQAAPPTLAELEQEAQKRVEAVSDDPEGRYKLRVHFYNTYGRGQRTAGFGNSELNFMRWEINRGVLAALDDPQKPGSAWWRAVNGHFCYCAELGVLVAEAGLDPTPLPPPIRHWVGYIQRPSSAGWYRAHNSSIVEGYIKHLDLAQQENAYEQFFMNKVLYRVLYASAMVTGRAFGQLGPLASHPALPAVDILVSIPHFYPQNYPVTFIDKMHILHTGYSLREKAATILDEWFVLPQLTELYQWAADWLEMPTLTTFVSGHKPIYPYQVS
jgi:uncharacterized membrane protein